jgi:catechol 2,3-dioxygenase-like lactoylglutathione lyase family enzyme
MADPGDRPRVEIGRVHLGVADLERAIAFYDRIGFHVALRVGAGSAFLTGDGRHHHLVLHLLGEETLLESRVSHLSLRYADRWALSGVVRRLITSGMSIDTARDLGTVEAVSITDPDGHRVELYWERDPADYPRTPAGDVRTAPRPLDLDAVAAPSAREAGELREADPAWPAEAASPEPLSDPTRARLRDMRVRLLNLHKVLLDDARAAYEMDRGHVRSNATLLHLVINDPWFAWLHPLSELVVRIDEVLQPDAPATEGDASILLEHVAGLLTPGAENGRFAERYYDALQRQPAVIMAHAEVRRILKDAR